MTDDPRHIIARRCALELHDGDVVNLGIGIPTLAVNYIPPGRMIILHTENGAFGYGPRPARANADSDMANASGEPITMPAGAAIMDLATSLGAARAGYIGTTVLGALEVDQEGTLANWASRRNGRWWPGIGGAMDLCYGVPRVIAALQHTDKHGHSKIRRKTELPPTGRRCVKVIVTDKAVFDVTPEGLVLREAYPGLSVDDIRAITEAEFAVSERFGPMGLW